MNDKTNIEWCDKTWNPLTGCYGPQGTKEKPNRCNYCYAMALLKRFGKVWGYGQDPCFHFSRLGEPDKLKPPTERQNKNMRKPWISKAFPDQWLIFTCSMGELFGDSIEHWIIRQILRKIEANPQHIFQILTKCPENLRDFSGEFPENCWLGTSVDSIKALERIPHLCDIDIPLKFVSLEPLLFNPWDVDDLGEYIAMVDWVVVGGRTGAKQFIPPTDWVDCLVMEAKANNKPILLKDNLNYPKIIREFPSHI